MAAHAPLSLAGEADVQELNELVSSTDQTIARLRLPNTLVKHKRGRVARHHPRQARDILREALAQSDRLEDFLVGAGIPASTLAVFKAWFKLQAIVEVALLPEAALTVATSPAVGGTSASALADPFEPLSAEQLGERLRVVAATVRQREQDHALFSTLPPGRERGRVYPAFQAWAEIAGAPLRQTLQALGQPDGGTAWRFFASASSELEGLSPVEALSGQLTRERPLSPAAQALLDAKPDVRRDAVEGAADAFAVDRAA